MGKDWDHGVPGVRFWKEVIRVMKPGAHLLAFGGTRTYHRLAVGIEDAGFEIRDSAQVRGRRNRIIERLRRRTSAWYAVLLFRSEINS